MKTLPEIPFANRADAPARMLLVPLGEYSIQRKNGPRIQVVDRTAVTAMATAFVNGGRAVLVDQDHFSYDTSKPSEAMGWVREVEVRADGLWGRVEWTDLGAAAVANRRYRYISPAWRPEDVADLGGGRVRPLRLDTVALTNVPNMRDIPPLSNRAEPAPIQDSNQPTEPTDMKQIAAALGLAPDATEQQIIDEIAAIKAAAKAEADKAATAETEKAEMANRVKTLEADQITADLAAAGIEEKEKVEAFRPVLEGMKNREERQRFIALISPGAPSATAPLTNRAAAKTPAAPAKAEGETELVRKAEAEIAEYRNRNQGVSYADARNAVRALKPELFGIAKS